MTLRRFAIIAGTALLVAIGLHSYLAERAEPSRWPLRPVVEPIPAMVRALRPVYPYSVVPGGVYNQRELAAVAKRDPTVAEHYRDFELGSARLVTLAEDRLAYVSYRGPDGKIGWTQHRIRIPKGESLLTDGREFCRTRCGNRVSDIKKGPSRAPEPPLRLLALPNFSPKLLESHLVELGSPPLADAPAPLPSFEEGLLKHLTPPLYSGAGTVDEQKIPLPNSDWQIPPAAYMITPMAGPLASIRDPRDLQPKGLPVPSSTQGESTPEPRTVFLTFLAYSGGLAVFSWTRVARGRLTSSETRLQRSTER